MLTNEKKAIRKSLGYSVVPQRKGRSNEKWSYVVPWSPFQGYIAFLWFPRASGTNPRWHWERGVKKGTNQQDAKPTSRLLLVFQLLVLPEKLKWLCKRFQKNMLFLDSESNLNLCCRCSELPPEKPPTWLIRLRKQPSQLNQSSWILLLITMTHFRTMVIAALEKQAKFCLQCRILYATHIRHGLHTWNQSFLSVSCQQLTDPCI